MATTDSPSVRLAVIVEQLREFRVQGATGVYYVTSDENHQVRINLLAGEVASVCCRFGNDQRALEELMTMRIVHTRFAREHPESIARSTRGPGTDELYVKLLEQDSSSLQLPSKIPDTLPDPCVVQLSPIARQSIKQLLSTYMGPIGDVVLEQHQRSDRTVENMLTCLAAEIPDYKRAIEFLDRARSLINLPMTGTSSNAAPPAPTNSPAPGFITLSPAKQQMIRLEMIKCLGPMGGMLFDEHQHSDWTVETMLTRLAAEIPDSARAATFLALVQQQLQQPD